MFSVLWFPLLFAVVYMFHVGQRGNDCISARMYLLMPTTCMPVNVSVEQL